MASAASESAVGAGREIGQAELIAAAADLAARIASRRGRDVLVWTGPPHDPAERVLSAWALFSGAALVLEPEPENLAATAIWVRPSVFAGGGAERRTLLDWLAAHDRRRSVLGRPRLPLRRLHTVVATGPEPMPEDERALWAERGVVTAVVPELCAGRAGADGPVV